MHRAHIRSLVHFLFLALWTGLLAGCMALRGANSGAGAGGSTSGGTPGGGVGGATPVGSTPGPNNGPTGDVSAINHIIFMSQENRSFDTYLGHLNEYRASLGLPSDVDGMPADASNPAFD